MAIIIIIVGAVISIWLYSLSQDEPLEDVGMSLAFTSIISLSCLSLSEASAKPLLLFNGLIYKITGVGGNLEWLNELCTDVNRFKKYALPMLVLAAIVIFRYVKYAYDKKLAVLLIPVHFVVSYIMLVALMDKSSFLGCAACLFSFLASVLVKHNAVAPSSAAFSQTGTEKEESLIDTFLNSGDHAPEIFYNYKDLNGETPLTTDADGNIRDLKGNIKGRITGTNDDYSYDENGNTYYTPHK